jgi:hypothetical protein
MLSIVYNTHIHSSRYSGICLLGNVVSGKTYRQLNEQASEQKEKDKKTKFFDAGVNRWWVIMKNGYIYVRSDIESDEQTVGMFNKKKRKERCPKGIHLVVEKDLKDDNVNKA